MNDLSKACLEEAKTSMKSSLNFLDKELAKIRAGKANMFLSPIFLAIPGAATAPALIIVGVMMMPSIKTIHWEDYCKAIPAFITIIMMPLAYSISDGILLGVISYVLCHAVAGKFKEISVTMWILAALFVCKYIFI